ncbi:MAG: response regulator transcription factor [Rubrivivax sp.]|nr:response regulator transcription factor [Rubrivivax sp.]
MKVLLIDDHALFRDALGLLIGLRFPALELLQAGDLGSALGLLARHPDVHLVLLDLGLPDAQGLQAIAPLREHAPAARLVVLSADDRPATVLQAIDEGACGFVPKTADGDTLARALQVTLDGGVYLPPGCTQPLANALPLHPAAAPLLPAGGHGTPRHLGLTPRQADVLRLLIQGQPNKLICRSLQLSESTVKTHLAAVFRRLGVNSRTQAVAMVATLGLRLSD